MTVVEINRSRWQLNVAYTTERGIRLDGAQQDHILCSLLLEALVKVPNSGLRFLTQMVQMLSVLLGSPVSDIMHSISKR